MKRVNICAYLALIIQTILWSAPARTLFCQQPPPNLAPPLVGDEARWELSTKNQEETYIPDKKTLDTPTIRLNKELVAASPILIKIESNARTIRLTGQDDRVEFDSSQGTAHELYISSRSLWFDGKESIENKGTWLKMNRPQSGPISLQLSGADYASLKYEVGANEPSSAPAPVETAKGADKTSRPHETTSPGPESTGVQSAEKVELWKKAVFQLNVKDASKSIFAHGTGFVVSKDGYAVTNYHVVQGATGGVAVFEGSNSDVPVELWAAEPAYDLAIVKLKLARPEDAPQSLALADSAPGGGTEVYALGFPKYGFTVNRGIVSGVRHYNSFPPDVQKSLGYAGDSLWLQTLIAPSTRGIQADRSSAPTAASWESTLGRVRQTTPPISR